MLDRSKVFAFLLGCGIALMGYTGWNQYGPKVMFYINQLSFVRESEPTPTPSTEIEDEQKATVEKQWVEGNHFEWRIPAEKTSIHLKYKEKNGRLITEYEFNVRSGERIEIKAK